MIQRYQLVEFRHYEITSGHVPEFRDHFEAHYLAPQEVHGMDVLGLYEVVDRADRIVWIRAYADAGRRAESLTAWYEHDPEWLATKAEANRYLERYDNVLLLRPSESRPDFGADHVPHAQRDGSEDGASSYVLAVEFHVGEANDLAPDQGERLDRLAADAGVKELGRLVPARVTNEYPRLPVRKDDVGLWLVAGELESLRKLADDLPARLTDPKVLLLKPTASSTVR